MYWHESMGRSETESFRVSMVVDFWSGLIVHLETMVVLEEGIFFFRLFIVNGDQVWAGGRMVCVDVAECGRVYIEEGGFMNLEGSFVVTLIPALVSLSMHLFMAFLSTEDVFDRQRRRESSWWGILCWTK